MPQELLRSAVDVREPQRRWFMVPVSVAAHGAVAAAWFVMPLTAAGDLPVPAPPSGIVRFIKLAAPPPAPVQRTASRAAVDPRPRVIPTEPPPAIAPEVPQPVVAPPGPPVEGALPADVGIGDGLAVGSAPLPLPPPPPVPEPPRIPRAGIGVREPKKIVHVAPIYPRIARDAKIEGVVVLEAVIDTDGRIDRLRVLRSTPLLDEAAIAAVKEWRYIPTQLNGVPVPVLMTITVNFQLQ